MTMKTHAVNRTSPMGGKFLGTCILCGEENLTIADVSKMCENPENVTNDEAVLRCILPTTPVECEHGYDICPECDKDLLSGKHV